MFTLFYQRDSLLRSHFMPEVISSIVQGRFQEQQRERNDDEKGCCLVS